MAVPREPFHQCHSIEDLHGDSPGCTKRIIQFPECLVGQRVHRDCPQEICTLLIRCTMIITVGEFHSDNVIITLHLRLPVK
ncbi:hypothetical protein HMPREF9137_1761 [Prevotella denticola F0289]|nr:hypothetical protein HMPREF9137_1761 [Prevotella denticola F0289]